MRTSTRRQFHRASLGLAALLTGCGGGGGEAAPAPPPPPPAPPPAPPPPAPPPASGAAPSAASLLASLLNFAETAARNWNHGGHQVPEPFDANQGYWAYSDSTYEPWLFDRAQSWKLLHALTGDARWAAQAQQDLAYYESRLSGAGLFLNKAGEADTKYSYVHAWSASAAKRQAAFDATVNGWSAASGADAAFFTERELWVALYAAVELHKAGGAAAAAEARGRALLEQWERVCAGRGAPLVTYTQHEGGGPGGTQPTDLVSSPWMSALYFQAAREFAERVPAVARQVQLQASAYFDWLNRADTRGFYPGEQAHPEYAGLVFPAYLAGGTSVGDAGPDAGNADHALDLAGFCAFALKAKTALGLPTAEAASRTAQMKSTAARAFANWTRSTTTLPRYRLNPPRKFNWWVRGMAELMHQGER